jgi:hypothetical protein
VLARSSLATAAALLAVASPAAASQTVGTSFPSGNSAANSCNTICTIVPVVTQGPHPIAAPIDGVLVSWSAYTVRLRVVEPPQAGKYVGVSTGATRHSNPGAGLTTFAESPGIPVQSGQIPALDTVRDDGSLNFSAIRAGIAGSTHARFADALPNGGSGTAPNATNTSEVMLQSVVEPDSDGDLFGDESQDACVGTAGASAGCPPPKTGSGGSGNPAKDSVAPVLGSLALSTAAFRAAASGPSLVARRHPRVGTRVSYTLSEPARVGFAVQARRRGRRVGRRCRKPTRGNQLRRSCKRWVRVRGAVSVQGGLGPNSFRFSGRLRGRKLRPGHYRLVARATDAASNRGRAVVRRFRIVR